MTLGMYCCQVLGYRIVILGVFLLTSITWSKLPLGVVRVRQPSYHHFNEGWYQTPLSNDLEVFKN